MQNAYNCACGLLHEALENMLFFFDTNNANTVVVYAVQN